MDLRRVGLRTTLWILIINFTLAIDPNKLKHMKPEEIIAEMRKEHAVKVARPASNEGNGQSSQLKGNAEFAFRLYKALSSNLGPTENLVFSPMNIVISMAKLGLGSKSNTERQIRETLAYPDVEYAEDLADELSNSIDRLDDLKDSYSFFMADGLFVDGDLNVLDKFRSDMQKHFFSNIERLEFNDEGNSVNSWLYKESDGELKEFPFAIDETSRLLCTNVLSFDNVWDKKFDPTQTEEGDFLLANGETVQVPLMKQTNRFFGRHMSKFDVKMAELPLLNREMSMFIIMPLLSKKEEDGGESAEDFENFEDLLTAEHLANPHKAFGTFLMELTTQLTLPKFSFHQTHDLVDSIKSIGVTDLFTEEVDLSGMIGSENIFVDHLLHSTSINIDETGSDNPTDPFLVDPSLAAQQKHDVIFKVDRPFIFFIKENKSKDILLMGKINNPKSNMNAVITKYDNIEL